MSPRLVVAGNLIVDDVVYQNGSTSFGQAGGAALYAALGASLWGIRVSVASVVGDDYPEQVLSALTDKGIDLDAVRRVRGPGLRIWLLYEGRRRQVVHHLRSRTHAEMSPEPADLPAFEPGTSYHLAPMPLSVQADWIQSLHSREAGTELVSLDPYELIREENLPHVQSLFHRADLVFLSEDELLLESALESPETCLERLAAAPEGASGCLRTLILKRGERGGLAYECGQGALRGWTARPTPSVDSTGAGDAFAGGVLAALIQGCSLASALRHGVVSASFALEARGAGGLLQATPAEAAERMGDWFGGLPE